MSSVVKTQKDLLEVFHDVFHSLQLSTDLVHGQRFEFKIGHPGQKERERNSLATSLSKAPAWVSIMRLRCLRATVWCRQRWTIQVPQCLGAFVAGKLLGFYSSVFYILSNHIFELLSFRFENAQPGRARLLLFHLYWDDLLIVGCSWRILMLGWPEEKDSQVSQQRRKRLQAARPARERARG